MTAEKLKAKYADKIAVETVTTVTMCYSELESLIRDRFNAPDFDFIATTEAYEETKTYDVEGDISKNFMIDDPDFVDSCDLEYISELLEIMSAEGIIPTGKYLIDCP